LALVGNVDELGRVAPATNDLRRVTVNNIIWIIGAIVVVLAILSFLGLR
jgi:hypothetical protein